MSLRLVFRGQGFIVVFKCKIAIYEKISFYEVTRFDRYPQRLRLATIFKLSLIDQKIILHLFRLNRTFLCRIQICTFHYNIVVTLLYHVNNTHLLGKYCMFYIYIYFFNNDLYYI